MLHKNITTGDQHFLYNWTVASTSNLAGVAVVASDVGKVALVTGNSNFYILQDSTPTWQNIGGSGGGGGAALSAGSQSVSTGTVNFANSNNITFGMSNSNQVTASYNFNASAGTTSGNVNALTLADSNGISFGLNGGVITGTVQTNYLQTQSNQAASASNGSFAFQTLGFSNANGVTFGTSAGNIVTASVNAGGGATISAWDTGLPGTVTSLNTLGQNSIYFVPFILPQYLAVNRAQIAISNNAISTASNAYANSSTIQWGVYYRDAANTSRLLSSISGTQSGYLSRSSNVSATLLYASPDSTYSVTGNNNVVVSDIVLKLYSLGINSTLSPGEYWLGMVLSTASLGGGGYAHSALFGYNAYLSNGIIGFKGVTSATSFASYNGLYQGGGSYGTTSGALPGTVVLSDVNNMNNRLYFNLVNYGTA